MVRQLSLRLTGESVDVRFLCIVIVNSLKIDALSLSRMVAAQRSHLRKELN